MDEVEKKENVGYTEAWELMIESPDFEAICYSHRQQLALKLGLRAAQNSVDLNELLNKAWEKGKEPWKLKTDLETYRLFKPSHRPPRPIEALGPYEFFHAEKQQYKPKLDDLWKEFRRHVKENVVAGWNEVKAATLEGMFSWWWEDKFDGITIATVIEQESAMYRHHTRQKGGTADTSIPIMLYSLVQQLVRQDPSCYRLAVTLRPDHAWRLVAYPYFVQGMLPEDSAPDLVQMAALIPSETWDDDWKKGDVRIFAANDGNTAQYLPTVSPGFLAVADDLSTLEIPGLGTVEDLE